MLREIFSIEFGIHSADEFTRKELMRAVMHQLITHHVGKEVPLGRHRVMSKKMRKNLPNAVWQFGLFDEERNMYLAQPGDDRYMVFQPLETLMWQKQKFYEQNRTLRDDQMVSPDIYGRNRPVAPPDHIGRAHHDAPPHHEEFDPGQDDVYRIDGKIFVQNGAKWERTAGRQVPLLWERGLALYHARMAARVVPQPQARIFDIRIMIAEEIVRNQVIPRLRGS